ncbi:MAG: alpha/beta hydrolase [Acidobacteria bacterium]|nr:alpha/beta hydrolase [Acidobacteriota bacterium]
MKTIIFSALLVCFVQLLGFSNVTAQQPVPRFETGDCAVPAPPDEKNIVCGYLVVPEKRAAPNGRTIRLPIAILKSTAANPRPDPVLRTFGGPGASSLGLIRSRRATPFLRDRDLIVFEQRGTKYAQPALNCPEVDEAKIAGVKRALDARTARQSELDAARACYDRLRREGSDLSAYNSVESAADIEDLRRVLKIDKLNLWGLSYSSRLMLTVMRYHPQGIRAVVLESSLPPEINYDEKGVDAIVAALDRVFANCRADADCAKAYPALEKEFYETVANFNKTPLAVEKQDEKTGEKFVIRLDGNDFVTWIVDYLLSADGAAIANVPLVVHRTFGGDTSIFKRYAVTKLETGSGLGMRYSVWCGEEFPFEKMTKIRAQSFRYPGLKGYEVMSLPDICGVWKVPAAARIENTPVESSIPTLVVSAEYDAYTPPAWSASLARHLKNHFLLEIPWAGHGPAFSTPCLGAAIADFFDDPQKAPAPDCVRETRGKFKFVVK